MFNAIVQTNLFQVEGILAVILFQHVGGIIGNKITEGWRKVIDVAALFAHFFERDVTAIPRK